MPLLSSGRSGALVSATSTSPLGSTYSQRGCSRPRANAATCQVTGRRRGSALLANPPRHHLDCRNDRRIRRGQLRRGAEAIHLGNSGNPATRRRYRDDAGDCRELTEAMDGSHGVTEQRVGPLSRSSVLAESVMDAASTRLAVLCIATRRDPFAASLPAVLSAPAAADRSRRSTPPGARPKTSPSCSCG